MLTEVQIREAFHLILLRHLAPLGADLRLKGGVNLRLFYGSARYSEDMDLDADPRLHGRIRKLIPELLSLPALRRELLALGVHGLQLGDGPNKDTETVFRHKLSVVVGGVSRPTKIEVS